MNIIKKGDRVQTVTDTECNRAERRRKQNESESSRTRCRYRKA